MRTTELLVLTLLSALIGCSSVAAADVTEETQEQREARMKWFREARFGMFIHWGVYAVPAGEWEGKKNYGEWFMQETKMPVSQYEKFAQQFNPVKFDAREWVRMAKDAGMKYIVITSKHHDGFGIYRSDLTDWCIKSAPFQRDPLKELSEACREAGIKMCFYHSIMDWHHPDWGTRRPWNDKATGEPNMDRYVEFMKGQLKELVTRYGPLGILWFDGEWESPWTHERGVDLYRYVRKLQPDIIINNRVGKGRSGMEGMDKGKDRVGDYGTPEQQIPATGFGAGVDWESCMTMNNHWGYNKADDNWKSAQTLIRNLVDCASKGGNYLLNIGPTAEGEFPQASIERLAEIGRWMKANNEAIYGTSASPFSKLDWGRCTQKKLKKDVTRLYLHVFDGPKEGKLVVPGLASKPLKAFLLDGGKALDFTAEENRVVISVPAEMPDKNATVVALDIAGAPQVVKVNPYEGETPEQHAARMKWWHEAKFGMFIHWGVYAVPAGTYKDQQIGGIGEWIMLRGKIPVADYKAFAKQFNPVKYDPDAWAALAKEAGMKYIVITSKHHDGFGLFDSAVTDWDIMDATPYGKDLIAALAKAARSQGLKFGLYYSQAQDWNHPGGAKAGLKDGEGWDEPHKGSFDDYLKKIAVPQVREILAKYQPDVLWWDTPHLMTKERADLLCPLIALRPGLITNNRLGGGYGGDLGTPEQHIPATGTPGKDWETCMTMNNTWGYKSYDHNWKSTETLIRNLIDIVSKGGNYLLNVGPTAEGLIPEPSIERLKEVGKWLKVNGEAIYGTTASPFRNLPFNGRCTTKPGKLYLHVFGWPADGKLVVPVSNEIKAAYLLGKAGEKLTVGSGDNGKTISLPAAAPDPIATVVVAEITGDAQPLAVSLAVRQADDGTLTLGAEEAEIVGSSAQLENKGGKPNIGFWTDAKDHVKWQVVVTKPGVFQVEVAQACDAGTEGSEYAVIVGDKQVTGKVTATGSWEKFSTVKLAQIQIEKAGHCTAMVKPVKKSGFAVMNLRSVTLKPVAQ